MKNLEAKDQIFKGLFRAPFSILFGGPLGFIYNAIYTTKKVSDEIKIEENHKKYISSIYVAEKSLKEFINEQNSEKKIEKENADNKIKYLIKEFGDSEDPSFNNFSLIYPKTNKKNLMLKANRFYRGVTFYFDSNIMFGDYYPEDDFIKKYNEVMQSGKDVKKYRFFNNNERATFGFVIDNKMIFTGMFTQI